MPCYAAHSLIQSLSLGIMPALLQEIVSVYPQLSPPNLTAHISNRVCNALALLQCVASHPDTRQLFLNGTSRIHVPDFSMAYAFLAHIPLFLYPFLNTTSKTRPFEYLRLTSLGVIGALVKVRFGMLCVRSSRPDRFHSKTITIPSSTSSSLPKLYLFAYGSWKPAPSSPRRSRSSSSKKYS